MSKVIVSIPKNEDGSNKHALIRQSESKPDWGSVMVKQNTFTMSNGVVNERSRTAYFRAPMVLLEKLGLYEGADLSEILGEKQRIARKETTTPQYDGHRQKMNPETGEKIFANGQPVYLQDYVAKFGTEDELIISTPSAVATTAPASKEPGTV